MEFVSELKPKPIGRDHFQAIAVPFVISFLYFVFLYLQTFIKETNNEDAIGFTYLFKGYFYFSFSSSNIQAGSNFIIVSFLAIWVGFRTINLGGNIGNVSISGLLFGIVYHLLDFIFYLSFLNEEIKRQNQFQNPRENDTLLDNVSQDRELFVSNFLFRLLEFVFISIIFAGIYFEVTKKYSKSDIELYPNA